MQNLRSKGKSGIVIEILKVVFNMEDPPPQKKI